MYKPSDRSQSSFLDFNQPMGLHMNPNNRWVKMADSVPWDVFEKKYSRLFKAKTGNVAKPVRMALGALIIQTKFQYSDRELVEQITENPYLQYFIGLPGYQEEPPFDSSTLVLFRKRINAQMIAEVNICCLPGIKKTMMIIQSHPQVVCHPVMLCLITKEHSYLTLHAHR